MKTHFMGLPGRSRGAFTLTELLAVTAVITVLLVVLLPLLARDRNKDQQSGCLANLRQANLGLQMWVNDNNGWLPPGPETAEGLCLGQRWVYKDDAGSRRYLPFHLAAYLSYPPPDNQERGAKAFLCPGLERGAASLTTLSNRVTYGLCARGTGNLPGETGLPWNPFGAPPDPAAQPPHKMQEVQAFRSPASLWMLADTDKLFRANQDRACEALVPEQPVHGAVRNYLFFDGHVAAIKTAQEGAP